MRLARCALALALVLTLGHAATALAWPHSTAQNLAVANAPGDDWFNLPVSDGEGGSFVVWRDDRNGAANTDIYANHVVRGGALDPHWDGTDAPGHATVPGLYFARFEAAGKVLVRRVVRLE